MRCLVLWLAGVTALLLIVESSQAHDPDQDILEISEVRVSGEKPVAASSQQFITDKEILLQPQGRPAQILRLIPGFITAEHSGGAGKADQYFLRGFDADHGTDVAFFIDNMPINLRTHGHGQGYTDLNFIIPETIQGIDVVKGTYHAEFGDFNTAGAVRFKTREVLQENVAQGAGGQFDTQRYLLMLSPTKDEVRTLFAADGYYTNGPFENDNRYFRFNLLGKATMNPTVRSEFSVTGSYNKANWNGSGEIPFRKVTDGTIDRFGAIDPSEGGKTERATGRLQYHYDTPSNGRFFADAYLQYYKMDLWTNFTFFLDDPVNGDGIIQHDQRYMYGGNLGYQQTGELLGIRTAATAGFQVRNDSISNIRLGTQTKRTATGTIVESAVDEASYSPYVKLELQPTPWMRVVGGLRADYFTFDVTNLCDTCPQQPAGSKGSSQVSPKANLILGPWFNTELFVNYGTGFHSNDARSTVVGASTPLARAQGTEVGVRSRPWGPERLELLATFWWLNINSELVFVGDAGTTEARGPTRRYGVEVGARGQVYGPFYVNGSFTWTHAEFKDGLAIPLAPDLTAFAALIMRWPEGLSSQLQMTYLGVRNLTEDRTVKAPSWTVFDLTERYQLPIKLSHGRLEAFMFVQNLFDSQWEGATYAFASRLPGEPAGGVQDIHFVPGNPRFFMGGVAWYF
ncbi:MAG: TonB-dependent receptor plug domain-containing protein [Nitrospirae bacterium]|nr:TonB-dependent receptor plug domain-containing protein [Nitrospirota bacterium]